MKHNYSFSINNTGDYRESWRIFRIMSEFVEGYQFLSQLKKEVTILGSARTKEYEHYYQVAREIGQLLGKNGYNTLTGGGPGIMEAGNRGAYEVGGESIGLNIELPFEQKLSPYVKKAISFHYFFTRKVMLTSPAHSFVFMPGGFGTLDEFFEVVDYMDLGKLSHTPVILVGKEFWQPVIDFLQEHICSRGATEYACVEDWHLVETAQEVYDIIAEHGKEADQCDLSPMGIHPEQSNLDWRVFRIMSELVQGFEFLTGMVEDVTVLGTKSEELEPRFYEDAEVLGKALANNGFAVVTGGASGIAESANKGAMEMGGDSIGLGMEVEGEQRMNEYVTRSLMFQFPFTRKLIVSAPSKSFVFFPGGLGTMHHLFEVLTLIQTGKMERVPIILFGAEYWTPLDAYITEILAKKMQTIAIEDTNLYHVVDSVDDAMTIINSFKQDRSK